MGTIVILVHVKPLNSFNQRNIMLHFEQRVCSRERYRGIIYRLPTVLRVLAAILTEY